MEKTVLEELRKKFKNGAPVCSRIVETMGMLSTKIRFRIVCALCKANLSVNDLISVIGTCKQSNISLQLKTLTDAGIVKSKRITNRKIYSIADERLKLIVAFFERTYGSSKGKP